MAEFDKSYWEDRWRAAPAQQDHAVVVNPYLPTELADIPAGTVLDVGCGAGTEAMWLADHRWDVTAADISATALATARARAAHTGLDTRIEWIEPHWVSFRSVFERIGICHRSTRKRSRIVPCAWCGTGSRPTRTV